MDFRLEKVSGGLQIEKALEIGLIVDADMIRAKEYLRVSKLESKDLTGIEVRRTHTNARKRIENFQTTGRSVAGQLLRLFPQAWIMTV